MGPALPCGWEAIDRAFRGGLRPGDTALVEGPAGSGATALASRWAREAARQGEPVAVVDARGVTLPHVWVEPADGLAPIWVVVPDQARETWPAVDIALRSGAFGLVVVLAPPRAPPSVGPRLVRLARDRQSRLVIRAEPGPRPLRPDLRVGLSPDRLRWSEAPVGLAPAGRVLRVRAHAASAVMHPVELTEVCLDEARTDRLRTDRRAPDRRPPR